MIFRLTDFALVMFKICRIIGISKIELFSFSDEELNTFFKISLNGTLASFIGNKIYNNQGLATHSELIAVKLQLAAEAQMISDIKAAKQFLTDKHDRGKH